MNKTNKTKKKTAAPLATITKRYENLKAAHRQWRHPGHCAFIHGENWTFEITLACREYDPQRFVLDFGKLANVRAWLDQWFDHTLLVDSDDPQLGRDGIALVDAERAGLYQLRLVPSASAEGLAQFVAENVNLIVAGISGDRVWVQQVVCYEDTKNSATYVLRHG